MIKKTIPFILLLGQTLVFSQTIEKKERETILYTGVNFFQGYKVLNENKNEFVKGVVGSPNLVLGVGHHESYFKNKIYIDFLLLGGQKTDRLKYSAQSPYFGEFKDKDEFYIAKIFNLGLYAQLKLDVSTKIKETDKTRIDAGIGFDTYYIPPYGKGSSYSRSIKTDSSSKKYRLLRSYVDSYDRRFYFGASPFINVKFKKPNSNDYKRSSVSIHINWSPQKNSEGSYKFAFTEQKASGKIYGRINHISILYQLTLKRSN